MVEDVSGEITDIEVWDLNWETDTYLSYLNEDAESHRSHLFISLDDGQFASSNEETEGLWAVIFYGFTHSGSDAEDTRFWPPERFEDVEEAVSEAKEWMKKNQPGENQ
jgi:hypothetical protein